MEVCPPLSGTQCVDVLCVADALVQAGLTPGGGQAPPALAVSGQARFTHRGPCRWGGRGRLALTRRRPSSDFVSAEASDTM